MTATAAKMIARETVTARKEREDDSDGSFETLSMSTLLLDSLQGRA
jgi:hypothetical protein